jgi:hypothetical protein
MIPQPESFRRLIWLENGIILGEKGGQMFQPSPDVYQWLMAGDPCIQYMSEKYLRGNMNPELQKMAVQSGWAKTYMEAQKEDGYWGQGFYQPKWISTHYSLLDLRNMEIPQDNSRIKTPLTHILQHHKSQDGGVNPARSIQQSDVCVNGMFLRYACYFCVPEDDLKSVVDFVLLQQLPDGGFNCMYNRSGARHSSLHSTLSLLEGLCEYLHWGYNYRSQEITDVVRQGEEFILLHRLYKSDHTGEIIKKQFLKFQHPSGWYYNILRALEYFADNNREYDRRMTDAMEYVLSNAIRQESGS